MNRDFELDEEGVCLDWENECRMYFSNINNIEVVGIPTVRDLEDYISAHKRFLWKI